MARVVVTSAADADTCEIQTCLARNAGAVVASRYTGRDDFLDACAALWTAGRTYRGIAKRIPDFPECDSRGLDMAIWF